MDDEDKKPEILVQNIQHNDTKQDVFVEVDLHAKPKPAKKPAVQHATKAFSKSTPSAAQAPKKVKSHERIIEPLVEVEPPKLKTKIPAVPGQRPHAAPDPSTFFQPVIHKTVEFDSTPGKVISMSGQSKQQTETILPAPYQEQTPSSVIHPTEDHKYEQLEVLDDKPKKTGGAFVYADERASAQTQIDQEYQLAKAKVIRIGVTLAIIVIIGAVIFGVIHFLTSGSNGGDSYKTDSLQNGGYNYSFLFDKNAKQNTTSGVSYLSGYDLDGTNNINVSVAPSLYNSDCKTKYPSLIGYFSINIQGKIYNACSDSGDDAVFSSFQYNNVWQQIIVYSVNQKTAIPVKTAQTIMGSVAVI